MAKPLSVSIGDVFTTNRCGDCEVISILPKEGPHRKVQVRFITTGTVKDVKILHLKRGVVDDPNSTLYLESRRASRPSVGDSFPTSRFGNCKVVDIIETSDGCLDSIVVRFDDTGFTTSCRLSDLKKGAVCDSSNPFYNTTHKPLKYGRVNPGDIFESNNYGKVTVVSVTGKGNTNNKAVIRFLDTDYTCEVNIHSLVKGEIKDKLSRTMYGVGFLGDGPYKAKDTAYYVWSNMLERCYNPNYKHSKGYSGITVCEEWHNFQNFAEFYSNNYKDGYQLDKDLLVPGNNVYSPDTCMFIPKEANTAEPWLRRLADNDSSYKPLYDMFREKVISDYG